MEDDNEQQMTQFWLKKQSTIISWIKSAWSSSGFSFQSLLIRQVLAAVSGLLVNLLITPLVVCFIDEDFGSSSLKKTLLVSLVSMLLAYIFRQVKKRVQSQNCDTSSSWMDGINNPTGEEISNDYSVFTCFRFPVPEIMGPLEEEKGDDEDDKKTWPETLNPEEQVQSSSLSSKLVGSSSLSETRPTQTPLPQPSYQQQSVKSDPPSSSSPYAHHQWFLPSAPPSQAMKEKTKLKNSRRSRQAQAQSKKQKAGSLHCLLHKSLFHPSYLQAESSSSSLPRYLKREVNTNSLPARSVTGIPREKSPRLQQSLRAWKFMEEANFEKFKSDFARFRSMNNVESGRKYKAKLDANERRKEAPKAAPIQQVMTESNGGRRPAPIQIMTTETNCRRKSVDKGNRKKGGGGCVKRILASICIQILGRKRKQSQWNSRRFKQIAHAPFSSPASSNGSQPASQNASLVLK